MPSGPSLQSALFLERTKGGYLLNLKLPRWLTETDGVGEIEIRSGLGVRTYTASQLQRPQLVPVIPQLPLLEVIGSGDLGEAAAAIRADVSRFGGSGNYFRVSDTGGRLLAPEEPLEWGERYRLLTQDALAPPPDEVAVEADEKRRGWHLYEIGLPALAQAGDTDVREAIAEYLGRRIREPCARLYLVHPPAHHIELDGTHVFPAATERIILRRTAVCRVSMEGSVVVTGAASVRDLDDERFEIAGLGAGDFAILADGREEFLGRIEECDLFRPAGVRVTVGDRTWEIFEPGLRDAVRNRSREVLRIECPSVRVAEYLACGNAWAREGTTLTLLETLREPVVDAGNFGALTWPETPSSPIEPRLSDPQTLARRVWLEGLVACLGGPGALVQLRSQWSEANPASLTALAVGELARLRPHIQLARLR